jgi:hypothetical protein
MAEPDRTIHIVRRPAAGAFEVTILPPASTGDRPFGDAMFPTIKQARRHAGAIASKSGWRILDDVEDRR